MIWKVGTWAAQLWKVGTWLFGEQPPSTDELPALIFDLQPTSRFVPASVHAPYFEVPPPVLTFLGIGEQMFIWKTANAPVFVPGQALQNWTAGRRKYVVDAASIVIPAAAQQDFIFSKATTTLNQTYTTASETNRIKDCL